MAADWWRISWIFSLIRFRSVWCNLRNSWERARHDNVNVNTGKQTVDFCWNWELTKRAAWAVRFKEVMLTNESFNAAQLVKSYYHIYSGLWDSIRNFKRPNLPQACTHMPTENPVAGPERWCNMGQIRPQTPRPRQGLWSRAFWNSRDPLPSTAVRLPPFVRSDRVFALLRRMWANESKSLCSLEYKIHIWPVQAVQSDIMRPSDTHAHTHTCSGREKAKKREREE